MDKLIFIHIGADEKFYRLAREQFSNIEYLHNIYYLKSNINKRLDNLIVIDSFKALFNEISKIPYFALILHSRCGIPEFYFKKIPREKIIVWISFGFDLYSDTSFLHLDRTPLKYPLFKSKTIHYLCKHPISYILRRIFVIWKHKLGYSFFMKRIDYVSTRLHIEFELLSVEYPHAKNFSFSYIGKEDVLTTKIHDLNDSNRILVGNSASIENNHFDLFERIRCSNLTKKYNLIVPINYGNELYKKEVEKKGVKYFGKNIELLKNFIPYKEYVQLLSSCKVGIMGHLRQQALGNIELLILNGAKIFVYKDSVIYKCYKQIGIKLFTIEDDLNINNIDTPLSVDIANNNRNILIEYFSYTRSLQDLKLSIQNIVENHR